MIHAFYICLMIVAFVAGFLIGRVLEIKSRTMGNLILNLNDGSKDLFELHVTNDINLKDPPKQVVFNLDIPKGSDN